MSFLSIQLLNELLNPFHLTYNLLPFLLITFPILNSFWTVFWNSFVEFSYNFSPLKSLRICLGQKVQISLECHLLQKYFYISQILNFESLLLISLLFKINICIWFYISLFHFNCAMICFVFLLTMSCNLSVHTFFWNWSHVFTNFIF